MLHGRIAPAGPGQTEVVASEVVAGFFVGAGFGLEGLDIKQVHVAHVRLQALRALTGVTDGPDGFVDFAQDVLGYGLVHALDLLHFEVFGQLFAKAQAVGELLHDHVVAAALPQRLDDFFAPLDRSVGRGARAAGLELGGSRQQVDRAVGVEVVGLAGHGGHGGGGRGIGVYHHEQIELVHGPLHLQAAALRIGRMAPEEHPPQVGLLVDQLVFLEHTINPARHRHARLAHHGRACKLFFDPLEINTPGLGEVLPRALNNAVVTGQRVRVRADIGGALHVVVAAEDVGAATRLAHIAQRELQDAGGAHHGVAGGVLGLAHAPDDGARPALVEHGGNLDHLRFAHATGFFNLVWCPFGEHIFADLVHAIDPVVDVFFVFPAVFEDMVQQTEQEGNVGARADAHKLIGPGRCAGETRVYHDHFGAGFLGMQHVQQADRVRLCGVRADVQGDLAVLHVVVRIGHGTIAPGVGNTGYRGGVANTRLVVAVVAAPETDKLAQQVGLLVVVLARAHPVNRIWPAGLAQLHQLGADLGQRGIPADALVLAVDQFHRVTQAELAMAVLTQGSALGAVGAQVDRGIKHWLLAHPDTVFHHGIYRATDRAMGADRAFDLDFSVSQGHGSAGGLRFFDQREAGGGDAYAYPQP